MKYPRTFHIPQSPGASADDKVLDDINMFIGQHVIITEKMDGENTTIHHRGTHARSLNSRHHESRSWVKSFAASISPFLDENERIIGENMFAVHSLEYENLPSYFLGFAHQIDCTFSSWDDTQRRFSDFNIESVRVLYDGIFDNKVLQDTIRELDPKIQEGFVIRKRAAFHVSDFSISVAKYVRANHVKSSDHWMHSTIRQNKMRN